MPQTPLGVKHIQRFAQSLGSNSLARSIIAVIAAKTGTIGPVARKALDRLVVDRQAAKRIGDVIDAGTGTITSKDRARLVIGVADKGHGNDIANAINGV